jgi:predicted PurR-regulated permease PerM
MTGTQIFRGVLIILLTLVGAYVLLLSIRVILVLLVAIIIASAVRPVVKGLTRSGVPESVSIVMVYMFMALGIIGIALALFPPIVNQFAQSIGDDSELSSRIIRAQNRLENGLEDITNEEVNLMKPEEIEANVKEFVAEARDFTPGIVDDIGTTLGEAILIFVMGAYWLTSHEKAMNFITQLSPLRHRDKVQSIINEIETRMGSYVRGVVIVASIVGLLNFIVLFLLGVPGALNLAAIIAVTTTIPMIGGFLGGAMAVFMVLVSAPDYVLIVIITFLVIQQIENYILSPRIISNQVQMDPLLVIVYTAIGFVMFGIVGALIAVPVMGTIHILLTHTIIEPHKKSIRVFETQDGLPVVRGDEPEIARIREREAKEPEKRPLEGGELSKETR